MGVVTLLLCVLGRLQLQQLSLSYRSVLARRVEMRLSLKLEAGAGSNYLGRNEFRPVAAW